MAASVVDCDLVDTDLPGAVTLLNTLTEQVAAVTSHVQGLIKRVRDGMYQTDKGLSFLDLRYHLLLFYLQDVTHLISSKTEGRSLRDNSAIHRLLAVRTVLEKMRPIDQKLRYQIDKLVRTAVTGSLGENDPLQLRPRPENLISKLSESEVSEDEEERPEGSAERELSGVGRKYIPPKIAPVHYDGDLTEADKQKGAAERLKRVALRSSVIQELREQYSSAPEEIRERRDFQTDRQLREEQHRREYEESMMVRLNVSRKDRVSKKRSMMGMSAQLNSITHFGDISALTGEAQGLGNPRPKKKKRLLKKKNNRGFRRHR
ncbi:neuroguidin [Lepisosteus oculatus]|uniref:neuroguidin n=1 Tax=Lepisosteus oculatus TaxID=7918 RepID=UPI003721D551